MLLSKHLPVVITAVCNHTGSFHLYLLYCSAHVVEAIHLPPGQHSASWEELWTQGLTRQHAGGNRTERITQTAPGKPSNVSQVIELMIFIDSNVVHTNSILDVFLLERS